MGKKHVVSWIIAVLLILSGIGGAMNGSVLSGALFAVAGIILLPPVRDALSIKTWIAIVAAVAALLAGAALMQRADDVAPAQHGTNVNAPAEENTDDTSGDTVPEKEDVASEDDNQQSETPSDTQDEAPESDGDASSEISNDETISLDTIMLAMEMSLSENFGADNYSLEYDETGVTISVWSDNVAAGAALAKSGDKASLEAWNSMVESMEESCTSMHETLKGYGYDIPVMITLLNDQNKDNVLLAILDGTAFYDVVNDG